MRSVVRPPVALPRNEVRAIAVSRHDAWTRVRHSGCLAPQASFLPVLLSMRKLTDAPGDHDHRDRLAAPDAAAFAIDGCGVDIQSGR
jgi:hypothetical protein